MRNGKNKNKITANKNVLKADCEPRENERIRDEYDVESKNLNKGKNTVPNFCRF